MKISKYPWLSRDEKESEFNDSFPMDALEVSHHDVSDSSYDFTKITRPVEWWKEDELIGPIDEIFLLDNMERPHNYVRIEDIWKGRVLQDSQEFFVARLTDKQSKHSDRVVRIWKQKIDESLLGDIHEGASFDWTFGKRYAAGVENYQKMVFKPKLNLDIDDLDRMVKEMTKGFEDIFTEPEEDDTQP